MIKKLFIMLLMGVTTLLFAQTVAPKKCSTCGKPLAQCQYKGKHPSIMKPEKKEKTPQIVVSFGCITNSAAIFIDGKNNGSINNKIMLSYGKHSIKVTCDGYKNYEGSITVDSNNYYFYVRLEKLQQEISAPEKTTPAKGIANGHEWVDLGLSVKWATCNIGAATPEGKGNYYAWGETKTKSRYDYDNCFDCLDSNGDKWETYTKYGGLTIITPNSGHDAAFENWGSTWRMPTHGEFVELHNKCTWKWMEKNGCNGYLVIGPNGNSIFLPAAGWYNGANLVCVNEIGHYWSSNIAIVKGSTSPSFAANNLDFGNEWIHTYNSARCYGFCVRPVTK